MKIFNQNEWDNKCNIKFYFDSINNEIIVC